MVQTYSQIMSQISTLRSKAEELKKREVDEVIAKIKVAIASYGISADELFGSVSSTANKQAPAKTGQSNRAKFSDGNGNVWGGMGPRPKWLREALSSGRDLMEFLTQPDMGSGASGTADRAPPVRRATRKQTRKNAKVQDKTPSRSAYTDGEHSWSGMGPRPRWLKDAIAGGKTLDELRQDAD